MTHPLAARGGPLVLVLHDDVPPDAPPDDQDTLVQVALVCEALADLGWRAEPLPLTLDLGAAAAVIAGRLPRAVFNLVEAIGGDGRLAHLAPALLGSLAVSHTGADAEAAFTTGNKLLAKRMMRAAGIATPDWAEPGAEPDTPGRFIVKSVWEHASRGLDASSVVPARSVTATAAERQRRFGGEWFAERFVDGREFNLAILAGADGPEILPVAEMRFVDYPPGVPRIVDYAAKWEPGSFGYRHTRRSFAAAGAEPALARELRGMALACWACFGLNGYARVDFRVDAAGRPWVLEVNTNPCLSPDAGFQAAAAEAGYSSRDVVQRILQACHPGGARGRGPAPSAAAAS